MNILVQMSHPAHYHMYKHAIRNWEEDGHKVFVLIKTKDILEDLLKEAKIEYYNILPDPHRSSSIGILWDMFVRDWRIMRFCKKHKIDLLTGSTPEVAHVAWFLGKHSVNVGEDDAHIVSKFVKVTKPFIDGYFSPNSCDMGVLNPKTAHYPGFQKLTYMHPKRFTPSKEVVEKYGIDTSKPYFLVRFAKLKAYHDDGVHGISTKIAQRLVEMLAPHGKIYITSERPLEPEFEQYRLHINPLDIHHVMAFATLYIGDSQSMANEAAMLGVPSLRFNDFVGAKKIGVMEEMEKVYGLTYGISSHEPEKLYAKVAELLAMSNLREEFQKRRQKMLSEKIDVTSFMVWFIENYPESLYRVRSVNVSSENDPKKAKDFWKQFK